MPYTSTVWADAPSTSSPESAANFNNLETQYTEAVNSFEQDLFTPFVYGSSSFVATKDGTTASQLDVTSGVAFLLQTDSTLRRRAVTSSTQSTSGNPSTTLYLDLNPDGTWSWGTSHSGVSGYLAIASVTTDASANIAAVTDARTLTTTLFSGMAGSLATLTVAGAVTAGSYAGPIAIDVESNQTVVRSSPSANPVIIQANGHNTTFGADGSLSVADAAILQQGSHVALTGTHSAAQIALSYGSGVPGSLGSNEIYFQIS